MKRVLKIAGALFVCVVLALVILRIVGLNPQNEYPGLWMTGDLVTERVTDWTFVENDPGLIGIQTHEWFLPILPHSVNTGWYVYKGQLYIGSAYIAGQQFPNGRHWNRNVMKDPRVRLKIAGKLYDQKLVHITDPEKSEIHMARKNMNRWSHPGMDAQIFHAVPIN
jgi:hypothetical protein